MATFNHNQRAPRLLQRIRADYQEEEEYSDQRALDQESHGELDAEEDADSGGAGDSQQDTEVVPPGSPDLIMPTTLFGTKRAMGTAQIQAASKRLRPDANNATPPPNAYISSTALPAFFESTSPTDANNTTPPPNAYSLPTPPTDANNTTPPPNAYSLPTHPIEANNATTPPHAYNKPTSPPDSTTSFNRPTPRPPDSRRSQLLLTVALIIPGSLTW